MDTPEPIQDDHGDHEVEDLKAEARLLEASETTNVSAEFYHALMIVLDLIRQEGYEALKQGISPAAAFSELLFIGVRLAEMTTPEWRRDVIWPDHEDGLTVETDAVRAIANRLRVGATMADRIHTTVHHETGTLS